MSFLSTVYRGHDLLTVMPNGREERDEAWGMGVDRLDTDTGEQTGTARSASPVVARPFLFLLPDRDTITDFSLWLAERRGRYAPCWVPTWRRELTLREATTPDATALTIEWVGFTARFFPLESRRHIAAIVPGGGAYAVHPRRVTASVDNGDGTETLTIESAFGVATDPSTVISFLTLCRLDEDAVSIQWPHPHAAEARVRLVEIPRQVDA